MKYGLRAVSFDSPGTKELAEQIVTKEILEQHKSLLTAYKASPNLINIVGKQSAAKIIKVNFNTPLESIESIGVNSFLVYSHEQHKIENINKYFQNQEKVELWQKGNKEVIKSYNQDMEIFLKKELEGLNKMQKIALIFKFLQK